jgi:hypothetical protein
MKANAKPEISKKWWTSEKPADIKGADLEKALANAEKALADADKKMEPAAIDACLTALKDVESAADKTIKKECDKKKHKDLIGVLEKYAAVVKSESSRLDDLKKKAAKGAAAAAEANGEAEEEEDEGKLFEPDYLHKMLKLLRSTGKELNFGFGLDSKNPAGSKLLLARKGKPDKLFKALKQTGNFSNRLICFGTAVPDAQDGKTLVFKLAENAGEPPQIQKLGRQFLRSDKGLKFRKLKLVLPGGQTLEDTEPDTEEDGAAAQAAGAAATNAAPAAGAQSAAGATGTPAGAFDTAVQENLRKEFKQARAKWVAVRKKADQDIEFVKDGVRDHYLTDPVQFPIAMKKIKELDEIMDNLNDDLRDALDAYVSTPLKQQDRLREVAANARQLLENFTRYVDKSPLLAAIDAKEFANVQIKAPMVAAMRDLARAIA